jgi:hypothetical protein
MQADFGQFPSRESGQYEIFVPHWQCCLEIDSVEYVLTDINEYYGT